MARLTRTLVLCLVLAAPGTVQAQDFPERVLPGTSVRVLVPELGYEIGELAATRGCIHVRVPFGGTGTILAVPLHRVARLEMAPSDVAFMLGVRETAISPQEEWIAVDLGRVREAHERRCPEPPFREVTPLVIPAGGAMDVP